MANILTHDRETGGFGHVLHGMADIANAIAGHHLFNPGKKARLGNFEKLSSLLRHFAHRSGEGGIAVPSVDDGTTINGDDVAFREATIPWDPCTIMSFGDAQMTAGNPW